MNDHIIEFINRQPDMKTINYNYFDKYQIIRCINAAIQYKAAGDRFTLKKLLGNVWEKKLLTHTHVVKRERNLKFPCAKKKSHQYTSSNAQVAT